MTKLCRGTSAGETPIAPIAAPQESGECKANPFSFLGSRATPDTASNTKQRTSHSFGQIIKKAIAVFVTNDARCCARLM